jgi:hypothetical protein
MYIQIIVYQMKTRTEYLKELNNKFKELERNDLKKMKELLLMINLNFMSGSINDANIVISMIDSLRGDEEFFNWSSLAKECKTYIVKNPYKGDHYQDNPYQYVNYMIQATGISNFIMEFPENRISLIAETKFDNDKIYEFLSYCIYTNYNLCCPCTIPPIERILNKLLISNLTLPLYYPVYVITEASDSLWDLEDMENNMLPFLGTKEKFREAFKELNGLEYDKYIFEFKKERGYKLTPEEIEEYASGDLNSGVEEIKGNLVDANGGVGDIKCYRCDRLATDIYGKDGFWCSWCGEAFNPKDEAEYKKDQEIGRMKRESHTTQHPTFTCQQCGQIVQPVHKDADQIYHFRGWQCMSCGRMLCDTCHSPTLGQSCTCGSSKFQPIHLQA